MGSPLMRAKYKRGARLTKTASYTITILDSGKTIDNLGATAAITLTLPTGREGDVFKFECLAFYPMIITAGSADGMYVGGVLRADASSIMLWQIGHSAVLEANSAGNWVVKQDVREGHNRIVLREDWVQLPGLNAELNDAAESTRVPLNRSWEVLGTNGTSALATFRATGGMTLTTATGNNDQMIVTPHLDTKQSAWAVAGLWGSEDEIDLKCSMLTAADIDLTQIWIGFKETNTSVTTTDTDQAFFRFQASVNASWQAVSSNNNTDTETDTAVDPAASTRYDLWINVDQDFTPRFFINNVLVATNPVLRTGRDFEIYLGVQLTSGSVARAMHILPRLIASRTTP